MTTPKRVLIAATHYPVASGRYIARAFRRMGHDVRTVGVSTANQIWGMAVEGRHIWTPDLNVPCMQFKGGHVGALAEYLSPAVDGWMPDLAITADSAFTIYGKLKCPHVLWALDNHVRDYQIDAEFDHLFLAHHNGPVLPVDDNNPKHTWLTACYDPEYFTPSSIPMGERAYDICMIGVGYARRVEIIEAMRAVGLKVFAATGLLYEDYAAVYQNSRISLCVSAAGDVAQRLFETASLGCAILTDNCADLNRLLFSDDIEGQIYRSTDEAVELAQLMLQNMYRLERQASSAITWAAPHTWDARCEVVLDTMFPDTQEVKIGAATHE